MPKLMSPEDRALLRVAAEFFIATRKAEKNGTPAPILPTDMAGELASACVVAYSNEVVRHSASLLVRRTFVRPSRTDS